MSATRAFGTFFLPGPTEVRDEIMGAMIQPMIPMARNGDCRIAQVAGRLSLPPARRAI